MVKKYLVRFFLLVSIYVVSAQYTVLTPFDNNSPYPIWPPSGVGMAALILFGWELSPAIFLGAFLTTIARDVPIEALIGISIGNTLEALVGYAIFRRRRGQIQLQRLHDIVTIFTLAIYPPVIAATFGILSLIAVGLIPAEQSSVMWVLWIFGNALGILIITPLLLTWAHNRSIKKSLYKSVEAFGAFVSLLLISFITFVYFRDLKYLILISLVWIGTRFSPRTTSLATFIVSAILIYLTSIRMGPFTVYDQNISYVFMQLFIASMSVAALILSSVVFERKRNENLLRSTNENLERLVRQRTERLRTLNTKLKGEIKERKLAELKRDEFVGIVSHELKTPITSIKTYVQLLERRQKNKTDEKSMRFLTNIHNQTDRVTHLISDLLDTTKITAGKMVLEKDEFDIDVVISMLVKDFQYIDEAHTFIHTGEKIGTIYADKERLTQVLTNLLTNATKYSNEGTTITVTTKRTDTMALISVADQGRGIPKDKIDKIFERYYRVSGKAEKTTMSFGLGLYIAKEIIERHNGKIWVESTQRKGSTFYIQLPFLQEN